MFSMIDIGERAGSGIPGIVSVWEATFKTIPVYEQTSNPSRVKTTLDISEYVGLGEESSDNGELQAINEISSDKIGDKSEKSAINPRNRRQMQTSAIKSAINPINRR